MLAQIAETFAIRLLLRLWRWFRQRMSGPTVRIEAILEQGPVSRQLGFTEPAIKLTVRNETPSAIRVRDIRVMFCRNFGAPVAAEAPPGRVHPKLPTRLKSGTETDWYIPAEKLSSLLQAIHFSSTRTGGNPSRVVLRPRCTTGTGKTYSGNRLAFSKDANSHWRL